MMTTAMPAMIAGMADDLERLTCNYWRLVQRIRQLPMSASARAAVLADIEVMFREERDEPRGFSATAHRHVDDTGDDMIGK